MIECCYFYINLLLFPHHSLSTASKPWTKTMKRLCYLMTTTYTCYHQNIFTSPNCISRSISSSIDDWRKAVAASFLDLHIGSVWIRIILHLCFPLFLFFFLFFFLLHVFQGTKLLFMHSLRTVHGTHHHFIQKKILKIGLTALFTHLKIILLRYFQFSVFSKISCIQMDP